MSGNVSKVRICDEADFEWTIPDFLSDTSSSLDSPSFKFSSYTHSWFLRVHPNCNGQITSLYLYAERPFTSEERRCKICITAGLKKSNGSVDRKEACDWIFQKNDLDQGWQNFWARNDIFECRSVLLPKGTLTIVFFMREGVPQPKEAIKIMGLETLSCNFKDLFNRQSHTDVTIRVQNKVFLVHKCILVARSPVFAAAFEHDMTEKETGVITIVDCCPSTFEDFLNYLYSGQIRDCPFKDMCQLYIVADKYKVDELKTFCVSYIIPKLAVENVCDAAILADRHEESELMSTAQAFFNRNFCDVLSTSEWESLMSDYFPLGNKLLKELASTVKLQL